LIKRIDEYFTKTIHVLPFYQAQNKVVKKNGIGEVAAISGMNCAAIDEVK
jgi:adenylate kinase